MGTVAWLYAIGFLVEVPTRNSGMRTIAVSQKRGPVAPCSLPRARQIISKHLLIEVPEREAYCFTDSVVGDDDDDDDDGGNQHCLFCADAAF